MKISTTIGTWLKRGTVLGVMAVGAMAVMAQDTFEYGGIVYKEGAKTGAKKLELTVQKPNSKYGVEDYVGDIVVPGTFTYNGNDYKVVSVASAFKGCQNLTSLVIGEGVTAMNRGAFEGDSALVSITIPTTITATKTGDTFKGCKSLKELRLHGKFAGLNAADLSGCVSLEKIVIEEGETPINIDGDNYYLFTTTTRFPNLREIEIYRPVVTDGKTMTDKIVRGNKTLEKVTIGGKFVNIPASYFENCTSLKEVVILNEPTEFGSNLFAGTGISEITIPSSVTSVSASAFQGCKQLKKVTLSEGVTSIQTMAFYKSGVQEINFPSTLKSIGAYAFADSKIVGDVVFPEGLTSIGTDAFENNNAITSFSLPSSLTSISEGAFNSCSKLAKFNLAEGNTKFSVSTGGEYVLGDDNTKLLAFAPACDMTEVIVPVKAVGAKALRGAKNVTRVIFGHECQNWGDYCLAGTGIGELSLTGQVGTGVAEGCPNLNSLALLDMSYVPQAVVKDCPNFTIANLGDKITVIRPQAFMNTTSLESLNLGSMLSIIEAEPFAGSSVKNLVVSAANPAAMAEGVFTSASDITVTVPVDLVDTYKNAGGWNVLNIVGDANLASGPTDMGMPAGLYYAGEDGNLYAVYADGETDMYDVGGAPHTFQLCEFANRIYGASAGDKFVWSASATKEGDGKLFYISQLGGSVFMATVLDNAGEDAYKDPFGLYIYGDMLYVSDRNVCVRKIPANAISLPSSYPSWMENNWMGWYNVNWTYGCIKSGWSITQGSDAEGNPEPEFWMSIKYNGNGLYRFKESNIGTSSSAPGAKPANGTFLTSAGLIITTFYIDEANDHIYFYIETGGDEDNIVKGAVYRINRSDLEANPNPASFFDLNPVKIDGSPVKYEGSATNEHVGISQFNSDGKYLYWCYRAPSATEAANNEDQDYTAQCKGRYWWADKYDATNPLHQSGIKRIKLGEAQPEVEMVAPGAVGYGVVPVKFDGSSKPEGVKVITAESADMALCVTSEGITVDAEAYVRVYDMNGVIVAQRVLAAGEVMSTADLTAGAYIVSATLANGKAAAVKFLK